jgi:hypothetical protein
MSKGRHEKIVCGRGDEIEGRSERSRLAPVRRRSFDHGHHGGVEVGGAERRFLASYDCLQYPQP